MQMNASYLITIPKGTVNRGVRTTLERNGYKIKVLNTIDFSAPCTINPFQYIRRRKIF